jgi:hypothetical protein
MSENFSTSSLQGLNKDNAVPILEGLYGKYASLTQQRWREWDIDKRFYAGDQKYVNQYFSFNPGINWNNFTFNIIQQPCNMVTGYQRQHRKDIQYTPVEGSDQKTADQWSQVIKTINKQHHIDEKFSDACEEACTGGMCMLQPYLDFSDDPVNADMKLRLWPGSSFMADPYFREPDMSDGNFIWFQQFISKEEAMLKIPDFADEIRRMSGVSSNPSRGRFYFLPENYNVTRNDLLVMSIFYYKSSRKKKVLYNRLTGEVSDFVGSDKEIKAYARTDRNLEIITHDVPTWKNVTLVNHLAVYDGENPLGVDDPPCVPIFWNYNPEMPTPGLQNRSLIRSLRSSQFLLNRRIILNHDISESSINSGWIMRENSVANEEVLGKVGQGKNIILKEGENEDKPIEAIIQKIQPNMVPPSDMELANQLVDLVYKVSGVNEELLGAADDDKAALLSMLRQGAGLVTLQKYFDQWDRSLMLLGKMQMSIVQANWSPFKVWRILGEIPTEQFFSKNFQKYDAIVTEGLNTPVQRQQTFHVLFQLFQAGLPVDPQFLIDILDVPGKSKLNEYMAQKAEQEQEFNQQQQAMQLAMADADLTNKQADSMFKLSGARERQGRTESNIGLFEERLSQIIHNRSMALKDKIEALKNLLELMERYGILDSGIGNQVLKSVMSEQIEEEDFEKLESKQTAMANNMRSQNPQLFKLLQQ